MIAQTHSSHHACCVLVLLVVLGLSGPTARSCASKAPVVHDDFRSNTGYYGDRPRRTERSTPYHLEERPLNRRGQLQFPSSGSIPSSVMVHDEKIKAKETSEPSNRDTHVNESNIASVEYPVPDVDRQVFVRGWRSNDFALARGYLDNIDEHLNLRGSQKNRSVRSVNSYSSETTPTAHAGVLENKIRDTHLRPSMQTRFFRTNEQTQPKNPHQLSDLRQPGLANVGPSDVSQLLQNHRTSRSDDHSSSSSNSSELPVHKRTSVQYSSLVGPSFLNISYHSQVRAVAGQTAVLACIIRNLHNYTVSWVRARDINLLTADLNTYSSDSRFVASNPGSGPRWQLKIHHARLTDDGTYLCQVSATPPITTPVELTVTVANVSVEPAREVFVKVGSPVLLTCTVTGCPAPVLPMWYKGNKLLDGTVVRVEDVNTPSPTFDSNNSSQNTTTTVRTSWNDEQSEEDTENDGSRREFSQLYRWKKTTVVFERAEATVKQSGLYTCTNTCTPAANITLHVLLEEETAAMQHINCGSVNGPGSWALLLLSLLLSQVVTAGNPLLTELGPYSSQRIRRKN